MSRGRGRTMQLLLNVAEDASEQLEHMVGVSGFSLRPAVICLSAHAELLR
jgi:hypothetical protein